MNDTFLFSQTADRIFFILSRHWLPANSKVPFEEYRRMVAISLSRTPIGVKWFVTLALHLIRWGSLLRYARWLDWLKPEKQKKYLDAFFEGSFFRYVLIRPLAMFVTAPYYAHPQVSKELGFQEPVAKAPSSPEERGSHFVGIFKDTDLETEICIIGSGAGGSVVAKELAEKGKSVLILEEGGIFGVDQFRSQTTFERNAAIYRDGGFFTTFGSPSILLPTGRGVGGTTIINSGTCFRTPDDVLKKWHDDFGLPAQWQTDLVPYFERVEQILKVKPVLESVAGGNAGIIDKGVQALGLHGEPLHRNAAGCRGSGVCIFGCPSGAKQSMERSYLPLAFKAGAKLVPHAKVVRIHHSGEKAYKVEALVTDPATGKKVRLNVYPKKVVVAAGTLESPLLLGRSRLGRTSRELGKHLTIHPTGKMMALFDEDVNGFTGVPQGYAVTDYHSQGLMMETVFFPPWLMASSLFLKPDKHLELMSHYRKMAVFGFLVHDEGRGRVVPGLKGRPLVFYWLGEKEKRLMVEGQKLLGRILFAAGAKAVYPSLRNMHEITSPAELDRISPLLVPRRNLESAAFHPLGTCRMGMDPRFSVVDQDLKLHDAENVWVVDGSVFPTSLGVNPQITIMAFATRAAEKIAAL